MFFESDYWQCFDTIFSNAKMTLRSLKLAEPDAPSEDGSRLLKEYQDKYVDQAIAVVNLHATTLAERVVKTNRVCDTEFGDLSRVSGCLVAMEDRYPCCKAAFEAHLQVDVPVVVKSTLTTLKGPKAAQVHITYHSSERLVVVRAAFE